MVKQLSSMKHLLEEGLRRLAIEYSFFEIEKLLEFAEEIERWNKRFNLVRAEGKEIITKHILDSLSALHVINEIKEELGEHASMLDVGSGAGFPGIPLAVFLDNTRVFLLERSEKKVSFLKNAMLLLELKNTRVIKDDLKTLKGRYSIICFRAFSKIGNSAKYLIRVMQPGGYIVAFKGKYESVVDEITLIDDIFMYNEVLQVNVPFLNSERHIVVSTGLLKRIGNCE